ncbi:hypothetical protein F5X96DRAFT_667130 [Biscogniauxia mediterranea]|nr:hypothetical protein F5X96DRAFT_667130 [Biscogniauxia mediterranea]
MAYGNYSFISPVHLPAEIKLAIMSQFHSIRDLLSLALCSKALYSEVRETSGRACYDILSRDMRPATLAIAVARHAAATAPWKCSRDPDAPITTGDPEFAQHVAEYCAKYLSGCGTELLLPRHEFHLRMAFSIEKFHAVIEAAAHSHVDYLEWPTDLVREILDRTPAENARFEKVYYVIDIISNLFLWGPETEGVEEEGPEDASDEAIKQVYKDFWLNFAPWEAQYMRMVEIDMAAYLCECYPPDVTKGIIDPVRGRYDWISIILWLGVEQARGLFTDTISWPLEQISKVNSILRDPRFPRIRDQIHEDPSIWFVRDTASGLKYRGRRPVIVDLETLRRYEARIGDPAERRAALWLHLLWSMTWHSPGVAYTGEEVGWVLTYEQGFLWWDYDRRVETRRPDYVGEWESLRSLEEEHRRIRGQPIGFYADYPYRGYMMHSDHESEDEDEDDADDGTNDDTEDGDADDD